VQTASPPHYQQDTLLQNTHLLRRTSPFHKRRRQKRSPSIMLNHSRRAPPPAPLIRLFSPNGEEKRTMVDQSSDSSSPPDSPSSGSASVNTSDSYEEYPIGQDDDSKSSGSSRPYFEMRMRWLKGSSSSSKHDSLPTSVSSISSPRSATSLSWPGEEQKEKKGVPSLYSLQGQERKKSDDTAPVVDWLSHLADSSFKLDGEVLLFFQSDQDPNKHVRFDC